ncbi:MAG: hypothetical protein ABSE49_05375 [Polyangiaceae bacterium]
MSTSTNPLGMPLLSFLCAAAAVATAGCGGVYSPAGGSADSGFPEASSDAGSSAPLDAGTGPTEAGAGAETGTGSGPSDGGTGGGFTPAAHRAFPQVPNTGKVTTSPMLTTVTASNDTPTDGTDTVASLQAFSDVLPGSGVWSAVSSEYHVGALTSVAKATGPAIAAGTITGDQILAYVGSLVTAGTVAAPTGSNVYLLYLPSGVTLDTGWCGDHFAYPATGSLGDEIAVVGRCAPWRDQETQLGELTRVASATVVGAATDPLGQGYNLGEPVSQPWTASVWQAWVSGGHVELESLCEGTRIYENASGAPAGGWELQRIYSNAAAAAGGDPCVPAYGEPFYAGSAPQDWYTVPPGGTVTIPLTGWSAGATSDWLFYAHPAVGNTTGSFDGLADGGVSVSSSIGVGSVGPCDVRYALNNGTTASVDVTAAPDAPSGSYVVFRMDFFRENPPPSCDPPITGDDFHFWPVGVYVP